MKAGRGLTMARMVELGGVSRASFYRYDEDVCVGRIATWTCAPTAGLEGESQTGLPLAP